MDTLVEQAAITVFVCANCARPGRVGTSYGRSRPVVPDFGWTCPVEQITVPCAGRLQPENVLKAFEKGCSIVSIVACREDNCGYVEGSRRCSLRIGYIRSILEEVGLGGERLLLFNLPGSASQDLQLTSGLPVTQSLQDLESQIETIREQVMEALATCPTNPMAQIPAEVSVGGAE